MYIKQTKNESGDIIFVESYPGSLADNVRIGFEWFPDDTNVYLGTVFHSEDGAETLPWISQSQPESWSERAGRKLVEGVWELEDDALRNVARIKVMKAVAEYRKQITHNASASEQASWPRKADAAARHGQGAATASDTLLAETEAAARGQGEAASELFDKWAGRDMHFVKALGLLDGMRSATLKAVDAAPVDQLDAVLTDMAAQAEQAVVQLIE